MVESPQVQAATLLEETGSSLLLDDGGFTLLDDCVGVSEDVTGVSLLEETSSSLLLLDDFGSFLQLDDGGRGSSLLDDVSSVSEDVTGVSPLEEISTGSSSLLLELDSSRLSSLRMTEEEDSGASTTAT